MSTTLAILRAESMGDLLSAAASLVSWKTLALFLALINLKNIPFAWHVSNSVTPLVEFDLTRIWSLLAPRML